MKPIKAAGAARGTAFPDRSRSAGRRLRQISRLTGQIDPKAHRARNHRPSERLERLVDDPEETVAGPDRPTVCGRSHHSRPDGAAGRSGARPIRKGKPQHPTQFGYVVLIADDDCGFLPFHQVNNGNPGDAKQLVRPRIRRPWPRSASDTSA
nr:hypothetical protein GCM10010200_017690 [Actinomadura rugatobispora]